MVESRNLQKVKQDTYEYFVREVDPVISRCITHLLITKPDKNIGGCMLSFLKGESITEYVSDKPAFGSGLLAKKEQRLYLATKVSPILNDLMKQLAVEQPKDVVACICQKLEQYVAANERDVPATENIARKKISEAVAFDKSHVEAQEFQQGIKKPSLAAGSEGLAMQTIQIALFGVGDVGKTSIINSLQGNSGAAVKPTLGFRPTTMMLGDELKVKFHDIGGSKKIRDIWDQYYHDVHGFMFVVDSSASDWDEVKSIIGGLTNHSFLKEKPMLLVANKQDVEGAISLEEICDILEFQSNRVSNVISCSAAGDKVDKNLESGVEWLLSIIRTSYDEINDRVISDIKLKANEEARKRIERERKVLKNKIASVFYDDVTDTVIKENVSPAPPDEIYSKEEGEKFLADEVGVPIDDLTEAARCVAAGIGYQRLALQMVGAFFAPVNKKKTPMSWDEIHVLVGELRNELGLPLI